MAGIEAGTLGNGVQGGREEMPLAFQGCSTPRLMVAGAGSEGNGRWRMSDQRSPYHHGRGAYSPSRLVSAHGGSCMSPTIVSPSSRSNVLEESRRVALWVALAERATAGPSNRPPQETSRGA
jgi:hypothetical protein